MAAVSIIFTEMKMLCRQSLENIVHFRTLFAFSLQLILFCIWLESCTPIGNVKRKLCKGDVIKKLRALFFNVVLKWTTKAHVNQIYTFVSPALKVFVIFRPVKLSCPLKSLPNDSPFFSQFSKHRASIGKRLEVASHAGYYVRERRAICRKLYAASGNLRHSMIRVPGVFELVVGVSGVSSSWHFTPSYPPPRAPERNRFFESSPRVHLWHFHRTRYRKNSVWKCYSWKLLLRNCRSVSENRRRLTFGQLMRGKMYRDVRSNIIYD